MKRREMMQVAGLGAAGLVVERVVSPMQRAFADTTRVHDRNIGAAAHQRIQALRRSGIELVSFTPEGGWVVVASDGRRFARNIPDECYRQLRTFQDAGHRIHEVSFPYPGGNRWVILTDRAKSAHNIPRQCNAKIDQYRRAGKHVHSVAFAPNGGFVVIADSAFHARHIPDELYQILQNFRQRPLGRGRVPRQVHQVAFTRTGGWVVLAGDAEHFHDVPDDFISRVHWFEQQNRQIDHVAFPIDPAGWSLISNTIVTRPPIDQIRNFEQSVMNEGTRESIWERMQRNNVSGVSVAAVVDNRPAWACGYGLLRKGVESVAVHPDSLFQAASISKCFAAVGAIRLLGDRSLDLDTDIREFTGSYRPPVQWGLRLSNAPTLRRLLAHRAGFNVQGFDGYARTTHIPGLDDILAGRMADHRISGFSPSAGNALVNNPRIHIVRNPGTVTAYSGGGYQVLQKAIEVATGEPFARWMRTNILVPMGMTHSTFALDPISRRVPADNVATGHQTNGNSIHGGGRLRYPQSAAAGLYTSAAELARLIILLNQRGQIGNRRLLASGWVDEMFRRVEGDGFGLGVKVDVDPTIDGFRYWHGGLNSGFKALFYGYPNRRAGVVVMTNGESTDGTALRHAIANAVVRAYGW